MYMYVCMCVDLKDALVSIGRKNKARQKELIDRALLVSVCVKAPQSLLLLLLLFEDEELRVSSNSCCSRGDDDDDDGGHGHFFFWRFPAGPCVVLPFLTRRGSFVLDQRGIGDDSKEEQEHEEE